MKKFEQVTSRAACFPAENINTDQIIPARFLKRIDSVGWGDLLFVDLKPVEIFGLPDAAERHILIAGPNFGCGSSREHAVWTIRDFGYRVLISTLFSDIFKENCFKNGLLAIELDGAAHQRILDAWRQSPDAAMTVGLQNQIISFAGFDMPFAVNSYVRTCLLDGLDELDYILRHAPQIAAFERARL